MIVELGNEKERTFEERLRADSLVYGDVKYLFEVICDQRHHKESDVVIKIKPDREGLKYFNYWIVRGSSLIHATDVPDDVVEKILKEQ